MPVRVGGQIEIAARTRRPAIATYVLIDELLGKEQVGPQFTPCVRDKKEFSAQLTLWRIIVVAIPRQPG